MSWKHIKTVLIFLFLIINIYLLYSSSWIPGGTGVTRFDKDSIEKTITIIKDNFNISVDNSAIPSKISNLKNINAANIIYTEAYKNSNYNTIVQNGIFSADIHTMTFSYNEESARKDVQKMMTNLGIEEIYYDMNFSKSDSGLVCTVSEKISEYPVFNGKIDVTFSPSIMHVKGSWHVPESDITNSGNSSMKMVPVNSVLVDAAEKISTENTGTEITDIRYGYFVSDYDENTVSKSASAIPCYMIKTDAGYKYYYDATNGKNLKQED